MGAAATGSRRIPSLDGLRAISVLFVIISHVLGTKNFPITRDQLDDHLGELGNFGVRIFFVISGFLITGLLLDEKKDTGRVSLRAFYLRRFFRIFPAAYAFIAVLFVLDRVNLIHLFHGDLLASLTYTVNFHQPQSGWIIHLWSLSVEEQFYLSWPAILVIAGAGGARWVAVAQIIAAPILRFVIWFHFPERRHFQGFETQMDSIATGCLLALCRPWLVGSKPYLAVLRSRWFYAIPLGVCAMSIAAQHSFEAYMAHDSVMNVGIAVCVHRFVTYPDDAGGRLLNWRPMIYIGTLSYSIYLWQALYFAHDSSSLIESFPFNVILALATGLVSFYAIEQPDAARAPRAHAPIRQFSRDEVDGRHAQLLGGVAAELARHAGQRAQLGETIGIDLGRVAQDLEVVLTREVDEVDRAQPILVLELVVPEQPPLPLRVLQVVELPDGGVGVRVVIAAVHAVEHDAARPEDAPALGENLVEHDDREVLEHAAREHDVDRMLRQLRGRSVGGRAVVDATFTGIAQRSPGRQRRS